MLNLTRGYLAASPVSGPTAKYYRKLAWASASFANLADWAMGLYGGNLKRMEKLTGRFGDIFSWMYLGVATLRRFEAEGRKQEDLPFVHWSLQYALAQIQQGFDGLFKNMSPVFAPLGLWSRLNPIGVMPADKLGSAVARLMQTPGSQRDRLTNDMFIPRDQHEALARLEHAFKLVVESEIIIRKITQALKSGRLIKDTPEQLVAKAVETGVIDHEEARILARAEEARNDAIQVDSFTLQEFAVTTPKRKVAKESAADMALAV
jgi:acyl-CoA dehydrogenase